MFSKTFVCEEDFHFKDYTWYWPGGVQVATVKAWGAGGSGAEADFGLIHLFEGKGGGGGGGYAERVVHRTGSSLKITVYGRTGYSGNGGNSSVYQEYFRDGIWFVGDVVIAEGGQAGDHQDGGAGGNAIADGSSSIALDPYFGEAGIAYKGGQGGSSTHFGGGGGGGGGIDADGIGARGGDTNDETGGIGGSGNANGGRGGDGLNDISDEERAGRNGQFPAGGGGGCGVGISQGLASETGLGAGGKVIIEWNSIFGDAEAETARVTGINDNSAYIPSRMA